MDDTKPSRNEEEFFARQDADLIRERRSHLDAERRRAERASHYMHCPKCGAKLIETEFHHIKVDKCPECAGIWFDGGEIELLEHIDQSSLRAFMRANFGLKW